MKKTILYGLVAGFAFAAAPAMAEDPPAPTHAGSGMHMRGHGHHGHMGGRFFARLDANKDGKVTREEMAAAEKKRFAEMAGSSPTISKDQFTEAHMKHMRMPVEKMFDRIDQNHDGKITEVEFSSRHASMFDRMDANKDGAITKDEMRPHGHMHDSPPPQMEQDDEQPDE